LFGHYPSSLAVNHPRLPLFHQQGCWGVVVVVVVVVVVLVVFVVIFVVLVVVLVVASNRQLLLFHRRGCSVTIRVVWLSTTLRLPLFISRVVGGLLLLSLLS
jgi:hypothetical protein